MDMILGVDVSGESERAAKLEAERQRLLDRLEDRGVDVNRTVQGNPLDAERERLRNDYDRKIEDVRTASGDALNQRRQRMEEANRKREAAMEERKAGLQKQLDAINQRAEAERKRLADEAAAAVGNGDGLREQLDKLLADKVGPQASMPLSSLTGLERGTVEAAKQAYENSQREAIDKDAADRDKERNALLKKMDANLARLDLNIA